MHSSPAAEAVIGIGGISPAPISALTHFLKGLRPFLDDPVVTEVCINRPGEAFVETEAGWRVERVPWATFDWCRHLAKLIATATQQRITPEQPLLSAALPTGERVQVAIPPATASNHVSITIRVPCERVRDLAELSRTGVFAHCRSSDRVADPAASELGRALRAGEFETFLALAVRARLNILVAGPTGSGKTTLTKGLILEIPPEERLITLEDAPELILERHPNSVRLFYSKDGQGTAQVTPRQLLESCLRMRPDRILLAELRSDEAFDYLRNVNSGHPGSITSIHAGTPALAFEQLTLLVKQSAAGRALGRDEIRSLLYSLIDVVVQCGLDRHRRTVNEIWYGAIHRPKS
jgi:type IV secretion system protein VirB11